MKDKKAIKKIMHSIQKWKKKASVREKYTCTYSTGQNYKNQKFSLCISWFLSSLSSFELVHQSVQTHTSMLYPNINLDFLKTGYNMVDLIDWTDSIASFVLFLVKRSSAEIGCLNTCMSTLHWYVQQQRKKIKE
jgi:hypothetical protein